MTLPIISPRCGTVPRFGRCGRRAGQGSAGLPGGQVPCFCRESDTLTVRLRSRGAAPGELITSPAPPCRCHPLNPAGPRHRHGCGSAPALVSRAGWAEHRPIPHSRPGLTRAQGPHPDPPAIRRAAPRPPNPAGFPARSQRFPLGLYRGASPWGDPPVCSATGGAGKEGMVRGQALQSSDELLTLHLLQLPGFRWELRVGNGTGSGGRARPSAGSRGVPSAPRSIALGSAPLCPAAEFDTTPARGGRGEKLNSTTLLG